MKMKPEGECLHAMDSPGGSGTLSSLLLRLVLICRPGCSYLPSERRLSDEVKCVHTASTSCYSRYFLDMYIDPKDLHSEPSLSQQPEPGYSKS